MHWFFKKKAKINTTKALDEIEAALYAELKDHGFKRHGRTLHRFVSGDISQVINLQSGVTGMQGFFCVNVGIRVPECSDRAFQPKEEAKKYYHEYECTMRSRLGEVKGQKDTWYDLKKPADKIIKDILSQLEDIVLPAFDVLTSREAILAHREDYTWIKAYGADALDECMIYGHLGNVERAKELFESYYASAVADYNRRAEKGQRHYLKKGERIVYMGQDITAKKSGYVTVYGSSHAHIDYLDELALELGLR